MTGNVWELCNDGFSKTYYAQSPEKNPPGPTKPDADEAGNAMYVMRGASWRIHRSYGPLASAKSTTCFGISGGDA